MRLESRSINGAVERREDAHVVTGCVQVFGERAADIRKASGL